MTAAERPLAAGLLDESPDALIAVDLGGVVLEWNQGAARIFNRGRDEALGRELVDIVPLDNPVRAREVFLASLMRGKSGPITLPPREGQRHAHTWTMRTVAGSVENGSLQFYVVHVREEVSAKGELAALLEVAPDAMIVVDRAGTMVVVNAGAEQLFGYRRSELVGKPLETLIPSRFQVVHRGHREGYSGGPRARPMGAGMELFGLRRDGTEFPADVSLSPLEIDGLAVTIAAVRDVTARRRNEARFRGLVESAPDAMVILDAQGKIVIVNGMAERLFGHPREDLLGKEVEMLVPERFRGGHGGHRARYFSDPHARSMGSGLELFGLRRDGSEFPVEISLSPLDTDTGLLVSAAIRDITDRKQVDLLRRALEEKETLLREIHHRVKNNLQVVSSLLNLQAARIVDSTALAIFSESRARVRSIALLHEKLYRSVDVATVDMESYLTDLVGELRRTYPAGGRLLVKFEIDGVKLGLDAAVPCGLIANELFTNVLKHAFVGRPKTEPGHVIVRMTASEGMTELAMIDDGVGVEAAIVERDDGTTLGLRLVRTLARQLEGALVVRSSSTGTVATLRFPS